MGIGWGRAVGGGGLVSGPSAGFPFHGHLKLGRRLMSPGKQGSLTPGFSPSIRRGLVKAEQVGVGVGVRTPGFCLSTGRGLVE